MLQRPFQAGLDGRGYANPKQASQLRKMRVGGPATRPTNFHHG